MKLRQTLITGSVLVGAGAYKTYRDYIEAPQEQKTRTLIRNTTALGAAALAVFSTDKFLANKFSSETLQKFSHKISSKILNNKVIKKISNKFVPKKELKPVKLEALSDMISNCTKDVLLSAVAGLAGISAGLIVDKLLFRKNTAKLKDTENKTILEQKEQNLGKSSKIVLPKSVSQIVENPVVTKIANERTRNIIMNTTKVFEAAGFISNPFEMPSVVLSGLDMAKERNLQKIVEQTSSGIVAEALIPTFCVSLTNSLTKNRSVLVKLPALAASFYVGDFIGGKVGDIMIHEIRDEIFDIEEDEEKPKKQEQNADN